MSGAVKAIQHILSNDADVLVEVAAAKIKGGGIQVGTSLPAIAINEISSLERIAVANDDSEQLTTSRIQVTVLAKTYPSQKSILELVRLACKDQAGTIDGVFVDSIQSLGAGPDFRDDAATIFMQSRDFLVKFIAT